MEYRDYLVSARSEDGQVRALAITAKEALKAKIKEEGLSPISGAALGRLLLCSWMMGYWLKGEQDKLTLEINGDNLIKHIVGISNHNGEAKGYIVGKDAYLEPNPRGHLNVGGAIGKGHLTVIRDLGLKSPYISTVNLVSGEIAEDLTSYFVTSEQTPSSVGLGVHFSKETLSVDHAGGFIIQLLPGAEEETISKLENNISSFGDVSDCLSSNGDDPKEMLSRLFKDIPMTFEEEKDVSLKCDCSRSRSEHILSSLSEKTLKEIADDGKGADIGCLFCGKTYHFSDEEFKKILEDKHGK